MIFEILAGYAIGRAANKKRIRELEAVIADFEDGVYVVDLYIDE